MTDKLAPKLSGEITILRNGILVYRESNSINLANASEILLNCMGSLNHPNRIDGIKITGPFGNITKVISTSTIDNVNHTITFVATAYEGDFNDYINQLELRMGGLNKTLAIKTGLSILKNSTAEIEIQWKIKLTI